MEAGLLDAYSSSSQLEAYLHNFHPHPSASRPRRKSHTRNTYLGLSSHPWLRRPCWEHPFAADNSDTDDSSDEDDYFWYYQNPERYVWKPRKSRVPTRERKAGVASARPAKPSLNLDINLASTNTTNDTNTTSPVAASRSTPPLKKFLLPSPTAPSPLLSPSSRLLFRDDFGFPELFEPTKHHHSRPHHHTPTSPPSSRSSSEAGPSSWVNTPSYSSDESYGSEESFDIVNEGVRMSGDLSRMRRRRAPSGSVSARAASYWLGSSSWPGSAGVWASEPESSL